MKQTKPYELLVRFGLDGAIVGAHVKAQSYYLDNGTIDLGTWREEPATVAVLESPELKDLMSRCALSLTNEITAVTAERDALAAQIAEDATNQAVP